MTRRKPVPRAASPSNMSTSTHSSVDSSVKRYTLTDRPMSLSLDQDATPLLSSDQNNTINDMVDRTPLSATMRNATVAAYRDDEERRTYQKQQQQQQQKQREQNTRVYQPYQPGQYLEPIRTGETLQLDETIRLHSSEEQSDPFNDPNTPLAQPLQLQYDISAVQPDALYQSPYDQQLSRLPPPSSDYHGQGSSEYYTSSTHGYSSSNGSEHMPAGSHLQHDTEAYTSATAYSTSPYRVPRSRSPTPAVDEEDYQIVGSDSTHHTGAFADPEKALLSEKIASHPVYLAFSEHHHDILYDPEPPTPTSNHTSLPETPLDTQHFGPAPSGRVLRRHKTKKRVPLTNGNLVVNLVVPPRLVLPRRGVQEMMQTRYTAVTCDPDEFEKNGFFLRQNESGRRTELLIMITMYNVSVLFFLIYFNVCMMIFGGLMQEDEVLFCRTLYGVMRNISHLCTRKNSQTWGPNAWEKVRINCYTFPTIELIMYFYRSWFVL